MATFNFDWLGLSQDQLKTFAQANADHLAQGPGISFKPGQTITYSFYTDKTPPPNDFFTLVPDGQSKQFTAFTATQQDYFRSMTSYLSSALNLTFKEVAAGTGNINLGKSNQTSGGYSQFPDPNKPIGFISLRADQTDAANGDFIPYYKNALWHELGHSLGLGHPNTTASPLAHALDTTLLTIMSADHSSMELPGAAGFTPVDNQGYSLLDIYELAKLYGTHNKPVTYNVTINPADGNLASPSFKFQDAKYEAQADLLHPIWATATGPSDTLHIQALSAVTVDASTGRIGLFNPQPTTDILINDAVNRNTEESTVRTDLLGAVNIVPADGNNFFTFNALSLPDQNNRIQLGNYFNKIWGGNGNDAFNGIADQAFINGGGGNNILYLQLKSDQVGIIRGGDQGTQVTDLTTQKSMFVSSIQTLWLTDKQIGLANANADSVARLYDSTFNRAHDETGAGYWIDSLETGASISAVANAFITSQEYQALYGGNQTNEQFISQLYLNTLDRSADATGKAYWLNQLETGQMTKAAVLVAVSGSDEAVAHNAQLVANGVQYLDWNT